MSNKRNAILWLFIALLMLYSPLLGQPKPADRTTGKHIPTETEADPMAGWTEQQLLEFLDKAASEKYIDFGSGLYRYAERAVELKSEKIARRILEFPEYEDGITEAKLGALALLKNYPGVHDYVINSLNIRSRAIQATAAATLLSWGEWDIAAPVICKTEAYIVFQDHKDDRAVPLLEDATENGSWQGRIYAALALAITYGDSTRLPQVALDIILNAPVNTDDEDINRAKYLALQEVPRFNLMEALPGIIRNAHSDDFLVSSQAVGYLLHFADLGYQEATETLIDIKENHPDASIREQAKHALLTIEKK
jgi:hypothetical protein